MEQSRAIHRFRANPVEVTIFSIVALVFVNSVYNLVYERDGFHPKTLKPMASNPISEGNRAPASAAVRTYLSFEVPCEGEFQKESSANKVRLSGSLCGMDKYTTAQTLIHASILNKTNGFSATVFSDAETGKYSTDYIPLKSGENKISVEFTYHNGRTFSLDGTIHHGN